MSRWVGENFSESFSWMELATGPGGMSAAIRLYVLEIRLGNTLLGISPTEFSAINSKGILKNIFQGFKGPKLPVDNI